MIDTNAEEYFRAFVELTSKEMTKALRYGLNQALKKIQRDAQSNLASDWNNTNRIDFRYPERTIAHGVRKSRLWVNKNTDGAVVGTVRADRHKFIKGSGSYRLTFLEKGTKERTRQYWGGKPLRKPVKMGSLRGTYFFKRAVDANKPTFDSYMRSEIEKAVDRINAKNNG